MSVIDLELEERVCDRGCGRTFKCLPSSTQKTARGNCEKLCFGVKDVARVGKPTMEYRKSTHSVTSIASAPTRRGRMDRAESIFIKQMKALREELMTQAKSLGHKSDNFAKMDIAYFQTKIEELSRQCGEAFSLPAFAKEIEATTEEVKAWGSIRTRIFDKISEEEFRAYDFEMLGRAAGLMRDDMKPTEASAFIKKFYAINEHGPKVAEYRDNLQEIYTFFCTGGTDLDAFDLQTMRAMHEAIKNLSAKFRFWGRRTKE